jgi:hypothetical protein
MGVKIHTGWAGEAIGLPRCQPPIDPVRWLDHERLAAVDHQRGAIHIAGLFGYQEAHGVSNVLARAHSARRDGVDELAENDVRRHPLGARGRLQELIAAGGLDAAGGHAVHPDPLNA